MAKKQTRPAISPEARENQLISAAYDLAERQILEGTASSQVITHFLKMGSERNRAEISGVLAKNDLMYAKVESIKTTKRIEELYGEAIEQFKRYAGVDEEDLYDEYE